MPPIPNGDSAYSVALVHDYLTQRGGAERVVKAMLAAFPDAPLYTSLYEPDATFPFFRGHNIKPMPINQLRPLRHHHRLALPLLAPSFSCLTVNAEVTICSSSGWAHGARTTGRKIVYCYTPARWLYQGRSYIGERSSLLVRATLSTLAPVLRGWDRRRARTANRYLVLSSVVQRRVRDEYGIDSDVLPPCVTIRDNDLQIPIADMEPGYWLCVSRLLPYKNVDAIVEAFAHLRDQRLVIVGSGPAESAIRRAATPNVSVIGSISDPQLAWLYANSFGLVAASYEDFGLTPLEANVFGKPAATLGWGGFVDTIIEGVNGLFFKEPNPELIRNAVHLASSSTWSPEAIKRHAARYNEAHFRRQLRRIVADERECAFRP